MTQLMSADEVGRAIRRICHQILEQHGGVDGVVLIGIETRGSYLADRLQRVIAEFEGVEVPCVHLDVTPFRDDKPKADRATAAIQSSGIEGATVILVDDVLYTGRTVRAAMDAITMSGRAARIQLAVLIDRGHRELPVRPDYVGKNTPTARDERISVHVEEVDGDDGVWIVKAG